MTRSATVVLEPSRYNLTYTLAWGWGMKERFSIKPAGALISGSSSVWIEIWRKPYNSGVALYRSADGAIYYLGLSYRLFWFQDGTLRSSCDRADLPAYTPLGAQLAKAREHQTMETLDPRAEHLFRYIESGQMGPIPPSPPDSRYYANLKYVGRFGLVRATGRGSEAGFVPADKGPEPRLGLDPSCG